MTRRYANPLAFKHALEDRLRNESDRRGVTLQRLRQFVVFERMLARLFTVFGDALTLKGGVVLELRLARARATKDIDLRVAGSPHTLLARMQAAGRLDLGDYMIFEARSDPKHAKLRVEGLKYTSQRNSMP